MRPIQTNRKAISPIIATLLLILIAIAAGVIVYAYVVGFIGASTTNSGGTTNTLSVDQLNLKGTSASAVPVTVYIRNLGPSTESFNTGYYVKGGSINDQIVPAASITDTQADTITNATLSVLTGSLNVYLTYSACNGSPGTPTVKVFGASVTMAACVVGTAHSVIAPTGFTFTNAPTGAGGNIASAVFSATILGATATVIGLTPDSGASIGLPINTIGDFTLTTSGVQAANPLTTGTTYTFSIVGSDGGTATLSAKSS